MKHILLAVLFIALVLSCELYPSEPLAVAEIAFQVTGSTKVSLSWDASGLLARNLHLFRRKDGETNYTNLASFSGETESYMDRSVRDGQTYQYMITSVNPKGTAVSAPFSCTHEAGDFEKTLVWSDEFDGSALDETKWAYDLGSLYSGWGNNELEYYQKENAAIEAVAGAEDGKALVITAKEESVSGYSYTSTRIKTLGLYEFRFGYAEARMKLPYGQGIWPAFWMMGNEGTWPSCGEIDIMEMIGGSDYDEKTTYGTIHWQAALGYNSSGGWTTHSAGLSEDFHTYGVEWDEEDISWFFDGECFHTESITGTFQTEFSDRDYYFLLNLAVGGNWPGNPDSTTSFPQEFIIDYIRVYQ